MKKSLAALTAFLTLGLALSTFAQTSNNMTSKHSLAGPYAGFGLGIGGIESDLGIFDVIFNKAGRIYGGYLWQQSPNILYGFEGGYNAYGDIIDSWTDYSNPNAPVTTNWTTSGYSADLLGVLKYHFNFGLDLFGKAGVAYTSETIKKNAGGPEMKNEIYHSGTFNSYLPEISLGVGYDFKNNISTNFTYAHIFGNRAERTYNSNPSKSDEVSLFLVNVEYHFA